MSAFSLMMPIAPVIVEFAIICLIVSCDTIYYNGEASTIVENRINPSSMYSNPVSDANSSDNIALF